MTDFNATHERLFDLIAREEARQTQGVNLIASENLSSEAVRRAQGSMLGHKYAEGYPGKRWYGGCRFVDEIEEICRDLACEVFNAEYANVQPHSGTTANLIVYSAFLKPGDTVLSLLLNQGGHLSHGSPANFSGQVYRFVHYPVDEATQLIDYDAMRALAREHKPKIILGGASSYPRTIDYAALREIADEGGALVMADIAHPAGLIAAGLSPNPFPHADLVTTTTHKTLRGPRGALILAKDAHKKKLASAAFPGMQGGPFMHSIAAKAVALNEARTEEFRQYQGRVMESAKAMARWFTDKGARVITGGTDCHFFLLDVHRSYGVTGDDAEKCLERHDIAVNKNGIPYDPLPIRSTSGLRIGTPFMCSRGWGKADFLALAARIDALLTELASQAPAAS